MLSYMVLFTYVRYVSIVPGLCYLLLDDTTNSAYPAMQYYRVVCYAIFKVFIGSSVIMIEHKIQSRPKYIKKRITVCLYDPYGFGKY